MTRHAPTKKKAQALRLGFCFECWWGVKRCRISDTCAAKNLSLVRSPCVVRLTKKPRAEASGVVVDSDLEIESERAASGAG